MQKGIILSVIIPTYNRSNLLNECLSSLMNQTLPKRYYEIIVVDDGSKDNTKKVVSIFKTKHKNIRYLHQKNYGPSIARNKGVIYSKGGIIAFTDDDCIVEEDWIKKIASAFKEYPDVVAVGGSIENVVNTNLAWAEHILDFSSWQDSGKVRFVNDIPTANVAYKKDKIQGLFFEDDKLTIGYRDSLFNHQLLSQGGRMVFIPFLRVYHHKRIDSLSDILAIQKRRGLGFALGGYKVHGRVGVFLMKFVYVNLLCPRLLLIFFRCFKSKELLIKFFKNFRFIVLGEFERNITIIKNAKL